MLIDKPRPGLRGTRNFLDARAYYKILEKFWTVSKAYAVRPVKLSSIQPAEWFVSTAGAASDICMKEMISASRYQDQQDMMGVLTPEFTGPFVKILQDCGGVQQLSSDRFAYTGPAYRYNRPQAGRWREFTQCGWEFFGDNGAEFEVLSGAHEFLRSLGIKDVILKINNIGTEDEQKKYADLLRDALLKQNLTAEAQAKLKNSPLRVLDLPNLELKVPDISQVLGEGSRKRFEQLCSKLVQADIKYAVDKRLVRGLDYYQDLVFEFHSTQHNRAILAGGSYDRITQSWNCPTKAVGWAAGIERILDCYTPDSASTEMWMLDMDDAATTHCKDLRTHGIPVKRYVIGPGDIKKYFAKANRCGVRLVVVVGKQELGSNTLSWKDLVDGNSFTGTLEELTAYYDLQSNNAVSRETPEAR